MDETPQNQETKTRLKGLDTARDRSQHLNPKHSKFVKRMRLLLPLGVLAIFALLLVWPQMDESFEPLPPKKDIRSIRADKNTPAKNAMLAPRFESQDNNKQPYVITADVAEQADEDENLVFLTKPIGDMALSSGADVNIKALTGTYHQQKGYLQLKGDVTITHSRGYTLKTKSLFINIADASANTKNAVSISGPAGEIEAPSMKISPDASVIYFEGPAKTILRNIGDDVL